MQGLKRNVLYYALILAAAVVPFLNSLSGPFAFDDIHAIVNNPALRTASFYQLMTRPEAFSGLRVPEYRPLLLVTYAAQFRLGLDSPFCFHLFNLMFHAMAAFLVFLLTDRLFKDRFAALIAAAIFAVHPVQSESLCYISSRSGIMASAFYLLCIYGFAEYMAGEKRNTRARWFAVSIAAACLALLCKAIAVTIPGAALLTWWLMREGKGSAGKKRQETDRGIVILFISLCTASLSYLIIRRSLGLTVATSPDVARPLMENLLIQSRVMMLYLRLLLWPMHLGAVHEVKIITSFFDPQFLFSIVCLIVIYLISWMVRGNMPAHFISMCWLVIVLAPTIFIPLHTLSSEHWLYLAVLGFAWPLSAIGSWLKSKKLYYAYPLLAVILFMGLITANQNRVWQSEYGLWKHAVEIAPGESLPHVNLGLEYKRRGNYRAAEREFRWSIKVDPEDSRSYVNLANLISESGSSQEAIDLYMQAISITPGDVNAWLNLALTYFDQGHLQKAEEALVRAEQMNPDYAETHRLLAMLYSDPRLYDRDKALAHLKRSLELNPFQASAAGMKQMMDRLSQK